LRLRTSILTLLLLVRHHLLLVLSHLLLLLVSLLLLHILAILHFGERTLGVFSCSAPVICEADEMKYVKIPHLLWFRCACNLWLKRFPRRD
jgi:hypothetical protein